MWKSFLTLCSLLGLAATLFAQYPAHPLPQYPEAWNALWATHPEIDPTAYGLLHFRRTFTLDEPPERFLVHVSGDNRYRLYVNGQEVAYGPQLGDLRHWRYESLDLAPFLQPGENVMAAAVMNWGADRSYGIISHRTAFLLQGHGEREQVLNTGTSGGWKVLRNAGMHERPVIWWTGQEIVGGFYAANPTDSVVAAQYPWGWETVGYDDRDWLQAQAVLFRNPTTERGNGHGWIMQPRTTARQTNRQEAFARVARTDLEGVGEDFRFGQQPLVIPPHTRRSLLIDQGYVTLGYPKLTLSGGEGSQVTVTYAEALYDDQTQKGNRNQLAGKHIRGIRDVYRMDGGQGRTFQPLWFRTFRFIRLEFETGAEALRLEDYHNVYSATDFPVKANFSVPHPRYQAVWDLCWHTLKLCAQDNLLSDAYYEQMQYVGDLRPHLKGWTALTGDLSYFRSAMAQFNHSRLPDGNITSCYPLKATFVHPTYSLMWIDMLHDLMMLEGDRTLLEGYAGEMQEVFDYYESLINEQGLVGPSRYPMFIDWYLPKGGNSPVNKDGNSAILTLNYAYTLQNAAEIMVWLGRGEKAAHYAAQSRKYAEITRKLCFDEARGLYADDPAHTFYDQRASILAVLCGAHDAAEKQALMRNLLAPGAQFDSKANLFYYFHLFEAMAQTGVGDFTDQLQPWQAILDLGMSGTPEKRVEQHPRSEIHPWTAHPVHYFFRVVAGIRPGSPGFESVEIAPHPGDLPSVEATYPTVKGDLTVDLQFKDGKATGILTLPAGMTGTFRWQGREQALAEGENAVGG